MSQPFDQFELPDGVIVGTGLQVPATLATAFPLYEDAGPMLTDAQIEEVAKSGRQRGKDKFDRTFIKNQREHGCHDDKTDVLTTRGWKKWTEYDWADPIGTMNPATGELEFQLPTEKHVYDYDGPLYYADHSSLDFALTPNHRMYVRKWNERDRTLRSDYQFVEAQDLGWYVGLPAATTGFAGVRLDKVTIPGGRTYSGDDFLALIATVISNGWVGGEENSKNRVAFCCFRDDWYPKVASLASRLGYHELPSRKGVWGLNDAALWKWLQSNAFVSDTYRSPFKKVPAIVKTVCAEQIKHFLSFFADQHVSENGRSFYTSSPAMADDIQELLLRIGKRSGIHERPPRDVKFPDGRVVKKEDCSKDITINEWSSDNLSITRKKNLETDRYRGPVFCATVPNSTIVTRRNGKVLISGNSCQGFASAAAVTRSRVRRGLKRVDLSGAYAYSLVNGGRDQGSTLEDGLRACQSGYATEATVPWHAIYPNRYDRAKAAAEAARFKAFEVYAVRSKSALFSALASGFDCVVAVHADNGFMRLDGKGVAGGGQGPGNHAVLADGLWWDGGLIADGVNSWDVTYGDEGRMGLTWERHFASTTQYHLLYAIRSALDDPNAENPPEVK